MDPDGDSTQSPAARGRLPSKASLDYLRALLEVVALVVTMAALVWYVSNVGPEKAAERIARGKLG